MTDKIIEELNLNDQILLKINENLKDIAHQIDGITTISGSNKNSYLGNIRFLEEEKVEEGKKILSKLFSEYGKYTVSTQEVTPCCAPKYMIIRFKIDIEN